LGLKDEYPSGKNILVSGIVEKTIENDKSGIDRLLLKEVYFNGKFFRDHLWIKKTGRLNKAKENEKISFTGRVLHYPDAEKEEPKIGLTHIRNVNNES